MKRGVTVSDDMQATNPASATSSPPRRCRRAAVGPQFAAARGATACMPSSFPAPRSPRRAMPTGAAGSTASARRRCTSRSRCCKVESSTIVFDEVPATPNQLRWDPLPLPAAPTDFVDGLVTMAGNGSAAAQTGVGIHVYAANRSMQGRFFYDADGELLIVPQQGRLRIATELGVLEVEPQEIAVIPRGIRFRVELLDDQARGYVARELRRAAAPAGAGPDRLQRPGQCARFPHAGRGVRRRRRRLRTGREIPGPAVVGARSIIRRWTWSPGTATTRRTNTTCAASTPSARSATTIPIRRSSRC